LNIDFGINNERQDCKISSVCGGRYLCEEGELMEEMKVRESG
jgi:hypothetical protein